jgi:hypothetical protein
VLSCAPRDTHSQSRASPWTNSSLRSPSTSPVWPCSFRKLYRSTRLYTEKGACSVSHTASETENKSGFEQLFPLTTSVG